MKYNLSMRLMHWIMATGIIAGLASGFYMTCCAVGPGKFSIYQLHKSFGVIMAALIILRIAVRVASKIPPLPNQISPFEALLSKAGVALLYILMILMPASGYLMSSYYGYPVQLFNLPLPTLVDANPKLGDLFAAMHETFGIVLAVVVLLHVIYAVKHTIFDKTDLLRRMV